MITILVPLSPKEWLTKPRITVPTPARILVFPEAVARGLDPNRPWQSHYDQETETFIYTQEDPHGPEL